MAPLIGAGIGAVLPLVMEAFRDKPDPAAAEEAIRSKRQEMIERAIGEGDTQMKAERIVDERIAAEIAAAKEAGEFNTPWGEMIAGAALGAIAPWAAKKVGGLFTGGASKAAAAPVAAAPAATAAPAPAEIASAMAAGMPLSKGKAVVTKGGGDVSQMMAGGPFPEAMQGGMPLSMGKAVVPKRASNVDVAAMLGGGPFPG